MTDESWKSANYDYLRRDHDRVLLALSLSQGEVDRLKLLVGRLQSITKHFRDCLCVTREEARAATSPALQQPYCFVCIGTCLHPRVHDPKPLPVAALQPAPVACPFCLGRPHPASESCKPGRPNEAPG